jgi:FkbM family methyltransferase
MEHYSAQLAKGDIDESGIRQALLQSREFAASREDLRRVEIGNGVCVVVDAKEPEFGRVIVHHRVWEPHIIHVIRTSLKPGQTFVDVGANVGVMSFHGADVVGPQGRVIAFEPNPRNSETFQRGLLANGFQNVRLFTFAASDAYRLISLTRASNAKVRQELDPLQFDHIVQADRLGNLLRSEKRVDFIKIDIEGYELPALDGLSDTISKFHPQILCEFNPLCFQALGYSIEGFARHIFTLTDKIDVIDHSLERVPVTSPSQLTEMWHHSDDEHATQGILPKGWTHFDLLFQSTR